MKNLMRVLVISGWFLCLPLLSSQAQSRLLDGYIKTGLEKNQGLKQQNLQMDKTRSSLSESRGLFMPQVSFNATYTLAGGGRKIFFPVGDLLNPVYNTLNQITNSNNFPTIENVNEQLAPNNFHETVIQVIQPLFNPDIYYNYKARRELISVQDAQVKVQEQELIRNIKIAYYQYLKVIELIDIYQKNKNLLSEVLKTNKKLVANDKATSEIIFGAEYEISKLDFDLAEAQKNKQTAEAYFNFLLNRPLEESIEVDTLLKSASPAAPYELKPLEEQSLSKRFELQQLKNAMNANLQQIELNKASRLPRVNAVANLGFQGFGYKFNSDQDFWLVQFSLRWELFRGLQNRHKTEQSKIEQQRLNTQYEELESQIRLQVKKAYYELSASQKSIEAARSGILSAEKNFNLIKKKYDQGQSRYLELIESQTRYLNAEISLTLAHYDLLIRQAELERAAGL